MKQAEIIKAVLAGEIISIVEFRTAVGDTIHFRDKKTGKMSEFKMVRANCEAGNMQLGVTIRVPDGVDPEQHAKTLPYKKGQRLVLRPTSFREDKGFLRADGELTPFEE